MKQLPFLNKVLKVKVTFIKLKWVKLNLTLYKMVCVLYGYYYISLPASSPSPVSKETNLKAQPSFHCLGTSTNSSIMRPKFNQVWWYYQKLSKVLAVTTYTPCRQLPFSLIPGIKYFGISSNSLPSHAYQHYMHLL